MSKNSVSGITLICLILGCGEQTQTSGPRGNSPVAPVAAVSNPSETRSAPPTAPAANLADNWPGFRGPTAMGTSAARDLPTQWSAEENIVWKTPLPGAGASSPIVFGDRVYLTCYTGFFVPGELGGSPEDLKRHLLAIDKTSGEIVWDKAVAAKLPEESQIRDHGFAANTPAIDDDRIYVFYGKTGVFAFDHDGQRLWQADVGERTHGWGTSASPVLDGELVFVNASVESGSLIALDRATGKEKWRVEGINESWNTPVVITAESGRKELIVARQGAILAFDPPTGKELWSCRTDIGWYMVPSIVAADGIVYCLGGRSGITALAVRAGGEGDVTDTHRLWTSPKGANVPSPVIHGKHLYYATDQGVATCLDAATGDVVYQERLERSDVIYASALLADEKLYYISRDGKTFVVAAKPEFEQLAVNDLRDGSIFNASPAVDGSRLLIRSDKFLYCLGK